MLRGPEASRPSTTGASSHASGPGPTSRLSREHPAFDGTLEVTDDGRGLMHMTWTNDGDRAELGVDLVAGEAKVTT